MIASSKSVKLLAVSVAALLHGAGVWGLSVQPSVEIEGASAAAEVSLGSSFADLAAGTLIPTTVPAPSKVVEPIESEALSKPKVAKRPQVAKTTLTNTPDLARPVVTEAPRTAQPSKFAARVPISDFTSAVSKQTMNSPTEPMSLALPLDTILPTLRVETVTPMTPSPPVEMVTPAEAETTAVTRSLRPQSRSAAFENEHKTKPVKQAVQPKKTAKLTAKKTAKKQAKAQPQGNAKHNAKAGSATGASKAKTKSASFGKAKKKKASGNAASSNYPGKVMRKIARVHKPRVGAKGSAVVAFTISANGGLSAISLARSSGSGQLDKAALRVVRKAAPFPPPPSGARRSFSVKIESG
ncbi:MAG: TonB family protein [Roseovarius sp.]|nr:TonB family protein [Roseovarius sp.]